jgi:hypothetical protein
MKLKPAPHTPGPWKVYQEKPHYYSVGTDYANDRGHDCNIVRDIRCLANARIMAAAPELLIALKQLVKQLEGAQVSDNESGDNRPMPIPFALAAIAKAEGRR